MHLPMGGYLVIDSPSERIFSGGASHHHVTYPILRIKAGSTESLLPERGVRFGEGKMGLR